MAADIAVVSFDRFLNGNDAERHEVARKVCDAFSTRGWVYIKDHGIPQDHVDEILEVSKRFFSLPLNTKLKYRLDSAETNQGYTADGAENVGGTDHKECYDHRRFSNPNCPSSATLANFRPAVEAFYAECQTLSSQILRCLALALNLGEPFFDHMTANADPQLRFIHYPSIAREEVEREGHARIQAHTDYGFCTLLFQDQTGGLEVDALHDGTFKPAVPVPGTVLVNIADLLQRLTNGRCRSTLHRVVSPEFNGKDLKVVEGKEMLPARFSIAFFVHPEPETLIEPVGLAPGEEKLYDGVIAGEWRKWKIRTTYGFDEEPKNNVEAAGA